MTGTEKQIQCAEQIVINFVAKCETIKATMMERIENYNVRSAKTGRDFSGQIQDTLDEITAVNKSIEMAQAAPNAAKIVDLRHIMDDAKEDSEWVLNGYLYNLNLITQ